MQTDITMGEVYACGLGALPHHAAMLSSHDVLRASDCCSCASSSFSSAAVANDVETMREQVIKCRSLNSL